jgi:hypothetical protein
LSPPDRHEVRIEADCSLLVRPLVLLVGLQMFAAENGEVVIITTRDLTAANTIRACGSSTATVTSGCARVRRFRWYTFDADAVVGSAAHGVHAAFSVEVTPSQFPEVIAEHKYGWADCSVGYLLHDAPCHTSRSSEPEA